MFFQSKAVSSKEHRNAYSQFSGAPWGVLEAQQSFAKAYYKKTSKTKDILISSPLALVKVLCKLYDNTRCVQFWACGNRLIAKNLICSVFAPPWCYPDF